MRTSWPAALSCLLALSGCVGADGSPSEAAGSAAQRPVEAPPDRAPAADGGGDGTGAGASPGASDGPGSSEPAEPAAATGRHARPDWLGTRELARRPDGFGEVGATPPELRDRRLAPPQHLPRPDREGFASNIRPVPGEVAERSTWRPACPVTLDELRYLTVTFRGFDGRAHTGELLVHEAVADDLVGVFEALYAARFPIEEMRVVAPEELDAPPTGDGNNTTAFVCRSSVGGGGWSQHARGLAVDVNPFHNPYVRDDLVLPELASAYVDRDEHRPGMIRRGGVVTAAFDDIGWGWGGDWSSSRDWMHFSANGR